MMSELLMAVLERVSDRVLLAAAYQKLDRHIDIRKGCIEDVKYKDNVYQGKKYLGSHMNEGGMLIKSILSGYRLMDNVPDGM